VAETTDLPNGYYVVPPGKLANAVTWLEMRQKPAARLAEPLRLVPVGDAEEADCRSLYAAIGTPWLWSRAFTIDPEPEATAANYVAQDDAGAPVGIVELTGRAANEVEITYFGLVPAATGAGLGRRMMAAALDLAFAAAGRVWLHTCNFDHPAALRFYRACGFTPFATGFEIMDDPRLDGSAPREAAPHVPLIPRRR
jgi:GNAT superfamily N-acetyltransferase